MENKTIVLLPLPPGPGLGFQQRTAGTYSLARAHTHKELFIYFLFEG